MKGGEFLKGLGVSVIITVILEALFYYIGKSSNLFLTFCRSEIGSSCPEAWEGFVSVLPYTIPIIFFLTLVIYFLIKTLKK